MKVARTEHGRRRPARHTCPRASRTVALVLAAALSWQVTVTSALADARRSYESPLQAADLRARTQDVLRKLDANGFYANEETQGFSFLLSNRWRSPFTYDIFGGSISSTIPNAIVRLEGDAGDVLSLARVLALEGVITDGTVHAEGEKPVPLERKSHLVGQGLNLLAPWASVLYLSWDSPRLTRGQTWFRALAFFLADVLIVFTAGTDFFRQEYGRQCPSAGKLMGTCSDRSHPEGMAAGLLLVRMVGAWQSANLARGHNQLAELKYTFYLDY